MIIQIIIYIPIILLTLIIARMQNKTPLKILAVIAIQLILLYGMTIWSNWHNGIKMNELKKIIIDQHKEYLRQEFELFSPQPGKGSEPYLIKFGSTIINAPKILISNGVPLVTMRVKEGRLLVSAVIYDEKGNLICLIRDNKLIIQNQKNISINATLTSVQLQEDKKKLILDCQVVSDKLIKLNGIFRNESGEVVAEATDAVTTLKGSGQSALGAS